MLDRLLGEASYQNRATKMQSKPATIELQTLKANAYNSKMSDFIYLDNHATTRVDPQVLDAMLPYFRDEFANAGSLSHEMGRQTAESVAQALGSLAHELGTTSDQLVITSGATEAANLAIFGVCQHPRQKRRKIVAVQTEHQAVLDPIARMVDQGFEVDWLPVYREGHPAAGTVDLDAADAIIDDQTALVCVMLVNNEIGVIQPIAELAKRCQAVGAISFCDATAGAGKLKVDVTELGVDMLCFSAHKFYGPKGVGGLYLNGNNRSLRVRAQILGGGQQRNLRSGTLNVPGIIGMSRALEIAREVRVSERKRLGTLQKYFSDNLLDHLGDDLTLNGPVVTSDPDQHRIAENLNFQWRGVEGQSLMLSVPNLCFSTGSACSSAKQTVSHVLTAISLEVDNARCSTRFGLGRFTTREEIDTAVDLLVAGYRMLRQ